MDELDIRIRRALEDEAYAVDVPEDLAERTIAAARVTGEPSWAERLRARRDARTAAGGGPGRIARGVAYAGAAAAVLVVLYVAGGMVDHALVGGDDAGGGEALVGDESGAPPEQTGPFDTSSSSAERAAQMGSSESAVQQGQVAEDRELIDPVEPPGGTSAFPPQIARSAEVEIEVADGRFEEAFRRALAVAGRHDGFITASSQEQLEEGRAFGTVTLRVPADQMDEALTDLRGLGDVLRLNTSGDDVSGQIVDVEARIRSLQRQEAQLLELVGRAEDVSDVLAVRTRLDEVRTEIERLQAQEQHLRNRVELATIRATISEPGAAPDFGPGDGGIFGEAWDRALHSALTVFAGAIVLLGFLVPFALIGFVVWLIVGLVRRRRSV